MTFLKGQKFPRNPTFILLYVMHFPNWLNFLFCSSNSCRIPTTQRRGAVGKAQATWCIRTHLPPCVHVTFRSEMKGMLAKSQHGGSSLQRLATVMARKANKRNILSPREWNKDPTEKTEVSSGAVKSTEMGAVCGGGIRFQCKHP